MENIRIPNNLSMEASRVDKTYPWGMQTKSISPAKIRKMLMYPILERNKKEYAT